jgi:glycosyltransferase involved in cell wall biosynthesis
MVQKQVSYPRRLLYVGRYLDFKGTGDLWDAFIRLSAEFPDWELVCAGTGEQWDTRRIHEKIIHKGFVQPDRMCELISSASWFILPSHREPWGVVVQEMATAGMPMILSDKVEAGKVFLANGENGYAFRAGDVDDLEVQLRRAMSATQEQFVHMQDASRRLSGWVTTEKWVQTLLSLMDT